MDTETRAFLEKYFSLIQVELERMNTRLHSIENRQDAFERKLDGFENKLDGFENQLEKFGIRQDSFEAKLDTFHVELRERFISTDEQFRTLTLRLHTFEIRIEDALGGVARDVTSLKDQTTQLTNRMKNVELGLGDLNARVDTLADEMRQRFRFRGA